MKTEGISSEKKEEILVRRWRIGRYLSIVSFVMAIVTGAAVGAMAWFKPESVNVLGPTIGWLYGLYMSIIIGYFGFSTIDKVKP